MGLSDIFVTQKSGCTSFSQDCGWRLARSEDFIHLPDVFTLRDFLASREADIREQMKLLKAELAELKRAKAAVEQPDGADDREVRDSGRTTIKDMVRSVFAGPEAGKGMAAGEVLDAIERSFSVKVERTSLSPQLSRLRESGDVVLQDGRWFPSEPRLSQAVAAATLPSSKMVHHGGGEAVNAIRASYDAARASYDAGSLAKASIIAHSAAEEAMKLARASFVTKEAADAAKFASATFSSAAAIEAAMQSGRVTAAGVAAAHSSTPHTMNAMNEADRKMRALVHGPDPREARTNWGSSPKTE